MSTIPALRVRDLLAILATVDQDAYVEVELTVEVDDLVLPTRTERHQAPLTGTRVRQDGRRWVVLEGE